MTSIMKSIMMNVIISMMILLIRRYFFNSGSIHQLPMQTLYKEDNRYRVSRVIMGVTDNSDIFM